MRIIKTAAPFIILFLLGIGLYYSSPIPASVKAETIKGPQIECGLSDETPNNGNVNAGIGGGDPTGTIIQATFNWGDGTPLITVSVSDYPNLSCPKGSYLYPLQFASPMVSHPYSTTGTYTVTSCLVDNAGLSSCQNLGVTVGLQGPAYDALGGGTRPRNL